MVESVAGGVINTNPSTPEYVVGYTCVWVIVLPDPAASIRLTLEGIDIGEDAIMMFRDGTAATDPLLADVHMGRSPRVRAASDPPRWCHGVVGRALPGRPVLTRVVALVWVCPAGVSCRCGCGCVGGPFCLFVHTQGNLEQVGHLVTTGNSLYISFSHPLNTTSYPIAGLTTGEADAVRRGAPSGTGIKISFSSGA